MNQTNKHVHFLIIDDLQISKVYIQKLIFVASAMKHIALDKRMYQEFLD